MAKKLKLGVIGMSDGNGHPYSWSAIFNGYESDFMRNCPFPAIPEYLAKAAYPKHFLGDLGEVSHIWTQEKSISTHIASASKIPFVVNDWKEMIGQIDALLLARDDAENHLTMARDFLKAGIPIFIDKPFALSLADAQKMFDLQQFDSQIFTCSSLRYADELILEVSDLKGLGELIEVEAWVMKKWETYGIHLLEPILVNAPNRGELVEVNAEKSDNLHSVEIKWQHFKAKLNITGNQPSALQFNYYGASGAVEKRFSDSFSCFKKSLEMFVKQIHRQENLISRKETLELVKIIETGRC